MNQYLRHADADVSTTSVNQYLRHADADASTRMSTMHHTMLFYIDGLWESFLVLREQRKWMLLGSHSGEVSWIRLPIREHMKERQGS